ncbi:LAME_0F17436g1_1 [Lachancea meyersii CBS 8951]|uniref:LAME_0F17436g1_1 n=1 Tax=Lachancea meyersii CBS 8951 TaxID=1266667 RepID=A0A1G4JZY9_9SACH|nr:LAME_0F17436g1_1 [Lachancea meyersii CBS 8951]
MSLEEVYTPFLSSRVAARKLMSFWDKTTPASVKPHPQPIDLGAGMPNEGLFPIESVHLNVVDHPFQHTEYKFRSSRLHRDASSGAASSDTVVAADGSPRNERELVSQKFQNGSIVDMWRYEPENPGAIPIYTGFQYSNTRGLDPMLDFCYKFVEYANPPSYKDWDITFANGSSDSLFKVFETLADASVTVLVEEFSFSPTISNITATGAVPIPIKVSVTGDPEEQGIDVEFLSNLLENWSESQYSHLSKPRLLYTIPTGQNPTGMTLSLEKRKQIYALAETHNFLIVEDDPYGYLRFPTYDPENPSYNPYQAGEYTVDQYRKEVLSTSFLSLDTSGRVIRCETFSKVFFPGLRFSFIVGNKFLISKILDFGDVSTRAASGVSQMMVNNVIQKWAPNFTSPQEAWLSWVMKVASQYTHRRNILYEALQATDAFKDGLFTMVPVTAGMFAALQIRFEKFPNIKDHAQAMQQLFYILIEEGVKVVLGVNMAVCKKFSSERSHFMRVTYAHAASDEEMQEAAKRLSKGILRLLATSSAA